MVQQFVSQDFILFHNRPAPAVVRPAEERAHEIAASPAVIEKLKEEFPWMTDEELAHFIKKSEAATEHGGGSHHAGKASGSSSAAGGLGGATPDHEPESAPPLPEDVVAMVARDLADIRDDLRPDPGDEGEYFYTRVLGGEAVVRDRAEIAKACTCVARKPFCTEWCDRVG